MAKRIEEDQNGFLICLVGSDRILAEQLPAYFQARQQGESCPSTRIYTGLAARIVSIMGLRDLRLLKGTPEQFEALELAGVVAR